MNRARELDEPEQEPEPKRRRIAREPDPEPAPEPEPFGPDEDAIFADPLLFQLVQGLG